MKNIYISILLLKQDSSVDLDTNLSFLQIITSDAYRTLGLQHSYLESFLGATSGSVAQIMNSGVVNSNTATIASAAALAPSQTIQTRPIMVSGQPQAMLPISSSVSNSNPPIDFTSLQPPPIETTLMNFASSQNQQIIQGIFIFTAITFYSLKYNLFRILMHFYN